MSNDLFSDTTANTQDTSALLNLVGEGKKFKDLEALAEGKAKADEYIETLKSQLGEFDDLKQKVQEQQEVIERFRREAVSNQKSSSEPGSTNKSLPAGADSSVDLDKLLEEKLSQREADRSAAENLKVVEDTLRKLHGDKVKDFIKAKSGELSISLERLRTLGSESPTALLSLLGATTTTTQGTPKQSSQAVTDSASATGERNWNYYRELMRTDRKKYFSPEVQRQMFEDRVRLGAAFGV